MKTVKNLKEDFFVNEVSLSKTTSKSLAFVCTHKHVTIHYVN